MMNITFFNKRHLKLIKENRELRKKLNQYEQVYPPKECPICGYKGIDFQSYPNIIHKEVMCPACGSHERYRAIWLYLENNKELLENHKKVLHFAPEIHFKELFESKDVEYHGVDLNPERHPFVEEKVDIQDIPYNENYFDLIICSHVLEHVPDDIKALNELRRVLKPGGVALILVPMNGISYNLPYDESKTLEKEEYNTPELRDKYYGQFDHLRLYGTDFKERILESGFELLSEDFIKRLGMETIERYALIRDERIYECTK
ncbi:MAG: class I SAM-dependent methyltransferase [Methanobrevibacter millerae]|uniref:Class I SAM-dependent methyltransferase n=2 Tax=Methanobrevibacter millerae TaxID=230361 RepID=A0A8T3VJ06_9EURY|nr:class I SAM-dependent methyltransferase [Methanobrevibacter millerae]